MHLQSSRCQLGSNRGSAGGRGRILKKEYICMCVRRRSDRFQSRGGKCEVSARNHANRTAISLPFPSLPPTAHLAVWPVQVLAVLGLAVSTSPVSGVARVYAPGAWKWRGSVRATRRGKLAESGRSQVARSIAT